MQNNSIKDENGAYVKSVSPISLSTTPDPDLSIDVLLQQGLLAIHRTMKAVLVDTASGAPSRDSIMNLKDIMNMLHELKKKEQEIFDNMSDDELKKLLKERTKKSKS